MAGTLGATVLTHTPATELQTLDTVKGGSHRPLPGGVLPLLPESQGAPPPSLAVFGCCTVHALRCGAANAGQPQLLPRYPQTLIGPPVPESQRVDHRWSAASVPSLARAHTPATHYLYLAQRSVSSVYLLLHCLFRVAVFSRTLADPWLGKRPSRYTQAPPSADKLFLIQDVHPIGATSSMLATRSDPHSNSSLKAATISHRRARTPAVTCKPFYTLLMKGTSKPGAMDGTKKKQTFLRPFPGLSLRRRFPRSLLLLGTQFCHPARRRRGGMPKQPLE